MDRNPAPLPPPSPPPKRPQIDRAALAVALAEQERRDAEAPPASLLTTMGAIRLLGDMVLDRKERGWSDPMLVALLRDLGVEISVETLRVYRGRLHKEREAATTGDPAASAAPAATRAGVPAPAPTTVRPAAQPTRQEAVAEPAAKPRERDPGTFSRTVRFDDGV